MRIVILTNEDDVADAMTDHEIRVLATAIIRNRQDDRLTIIAGEPAEFIEAVQIADLYSETSIGRVVYP